MLVLRVRDTKLENRVAFALTLTASATLLVRAIVSTGLVFMAGSRFVGPEGRRAV
jgi:hypothetical protein